MRDETAASQDTFESRHEIPPAVTSAEFSRRVVAKEPTSGLAVTRGLQTSVAEGDSRTFDVIGTASSVDLENETVSMPGTDLSFYKTNPVGFANHQSSADGVIFLTKAIEAHGDELRFRIKYAPKEVSPLADSLYQSHLWRRSEKALEDSGAMFSIRFQPTFEKGSFSFNEKRGGLDFHHQKMWELSDVGIGAMPRAQILRAAAAGVPTDPLMEWAHAVVGEDPTVVILKRGKGFLVQMQDLIKALDPPTLAKTVEIHRPSAPEVAELTSRVALLEEASEPEKVVKVAARETSSEYQLTHEDREECADAIVMELLERTNNDRMRLTGACA